MSDEEIKNWKVGDKNKSALYILPMLGAIWSDFTDKTRLPKCQFRNCFIGDSCENIKDKILLLYRFHKDKSYIEFEDLLQQHPFFEQMYEVDKYHSMFVYEVPESNKDNYNKLLNGEYSKIDVSYKKQILAFHELPEDSRTASILYKADKRREQLESDINKGIPYERWTKIPESLELEEKFNPMIEYYQEHFKMIAAIKPNKEFNE